MMKSFLDLFLKNKPTTQSITQAVTQLPNTTYNLINQQTRKYSQTTTQQETKAKAEAEIKAFYNSAEKIVGGAIVGASATWGLDHYLNTPQTHKPIEASTHSQDSQLEHSTTIPGMGNSGK